jgi:hypothetical protein
MLPLPRTSRYAGLDTAVHVAPSGRRTVYLCRRIVPQPGGTPLAHHTVVASDRLDNVTARHLGDPEQFWRVCDANGALRPDDLTERIGRVLLIPMPELVE